MTMLDEVRQAALRVGSQRRLRAVLSTCRRLLSVRGEANSVAIGRELLAGYDALDEGTRRLFFGHLAADFNPDPKAVEAAAKAYAAAWGVPFYAVNHLGGHLAADVYDHGPLPESVGLLVSGGHTHLLYVRSLGEPIEELGSTVDDAAGEAYDKVARLLGLGYPGGKALDDLARTGDRDAIAFPRGMTGPRDHRFAFSFSGVKTAVARYVESHPDASTADVAAGFQEAVADVLTAKAVRAALEMEVSTLLIAGGVAANSRLRELAEERCAEAGLTLRIPRPRLCTDNGAMIASFAAQLIAAGASPSRLDVASDPGLPVIAGQVA